MYCCLGHCYHCDGIKVTWARCWLVSAGIMMAEQRRWYAICECVGLSVDRMETGVSDTGVTGTAAVPVYGGVEV